MNFKLRAAGFLTALLWWLFPSTGRAQLFGTFPIATNWTTNDLLIIDMYLGSNFAVDQPPAGLNFKTATIPVSQFFTNSAVSNSIVTIFNVGGPVGSLWTNNGQYLFPRTNGPVNFFTVDGQGDIQTLSTNAGLFYLTKDGTNITIRVSGGTSDGRTLGSWIAVNGFNSTASNSLAPSSITVGSSPFSFTNTQTKNITVYVDGNGGTAAIALNGTTIFTSHSGGPDETVLLQTNEWVTVTYTVATPIMQWHPF